MGLKICYPWRLGLGLGSSRDSPVYRVWDWDPGLSTGSLEAILASFSEFIEFQSFFTTASPVSPKIAFGGLQNRSLGEIEAKLV